MTTKNGKGARRANVFGKSLGKDGIKAASTAASKRGMCNKRGLGTGESLSSGR